MASHRLIIETGRWQNPTALPFNESKCTLVLKLEDEFHFLLRATNITQTATEIASCVQTACIHTMNAVPFFSK